METNKKMKGHNIHTFNNSHRTKKNSVLNKLWTNSEKSNVFNKPNYHFVSFVNEGAKTSVVVASGSLRSLHLL